MEQGRPAGVLLLRPEFFQVPQTAADPYRIIPGPPGNAAHTEEQDEDGGKEQDRRDKQDKDYYAKGRWEAV
jgi:hypothetical protein